MSRARASGSRICLWNWIGVIDMGARKCRWKDDALIGETEEILGQAIEEGRRDEPVIATRSGMPMGEDTNQRGGSRRWIVREVENRPEHCAGLKA